MTRRRAPARAIGLWLLLSTLGVAGSAGATGVDDPPELPDGVDEALRAARRHFQRAEYDQALAALGQARRAQRASPAQRAEVWLLEGYVDVALDRTAAALEAFDRGLRLLPSLRPGPEASPKLRGAFAEALGRAEARTARRAAVRARLLEPEVPRLAHQAIPVTVEVTSPFDGLAVQLVVTGEGETTVVPLPREAQAGRFRGEVPAALCRPDARLRLRAVLLDGDEPFASAPAGDPLSPAGSVPLEVPLARAAVEVRSPIDGAEVRVAGRAVGRTPLPDAVVVPPGRVTVELAARGRRARQEVEVHPGELLRMTLAPPEGPRPVVVARYTLLGLGGALLVVGGVLAGVAHNAASDLENAQAAEPGTMLPATQFSDVRGFQSLGQGASAASIACLVVGGAALVVGAALFAVRPRGADASPSSPSRVRADLLEGRVRF